jgi:hypothetical protein
MIAKPRPKIRESDGLAEAARTAGQRTVKKAMTRASAHTCFCAVRASIVSLRVDPAILEQGAGLPARHLDEY